MSPALNLIKRTGQSAKLWWGFGVFLFGGTLMLIAGLLINTVSVGHYALIMIAGMFISLGAFLYLCFAIECPKCGARWIMFMVIRAPGSPEHMSLARDQCCRCGYFGPGVRQP